MNQSGFQNILKQVPLENWENTLSIGRFVHINCINFMQRPFSYIAKCLVSGTSGNRYVYVKVYKIRNKNDSELTYKIKNDFENTLYWYRLFHDSSCFHGVKPLFCLPELRLLATEDTPGKTFGELISRDARFFTGNKKTNALLQHAYNIGKLLKCRNDKLIDYEDLLSIPDFLDYIELRLKILTDDKKRHFPIDLRNRLIHFLHKHIQSLTQKDLATVISHGDFNPGNIIINEKGTTIIDIGANKKESYLLDITKMYSRIELLYSYKPYFNRKIIKALQKNLMTGFQFCGNPILFEFFHIRNTLTHLTNITNFHRFRLKENVFNFWVAKNEMQLLEKILHQNRGAFSN